MNKRKLPDLVVLPGALGAAKQFEPLKLKLDEHFNVLLYEYPGHGEDGRATENRTVADHVELLKNYIISNELSDCLLFGYSLGGYLGLLLAGKYPQLLYGVITFATKSDWTPEIAAKEIHDLNPLSIATKAPGFAARLDQLHGSKWKGLVTSTAELIISIGNEFPRDAFFQSLKCPVKIMSGDSDRMVSIESSVRLYRFIPGASLAILPRTAHPIEKTDTTRLANEIIFFKDEQLKKSGN